MSNEDLNAFGGEPSTDSSMITFPNMDDVEVKTWHADPGWYDAVCIKFEDTQTKQVNKNRMFVFTFSIDAGSSGTLELPQRCVVTPSAMVFLKRTLNALEIRPNADGKLEVDRKNIPGRRCSVRLQDKSWTDNEGNIKTGSEIGEIKKHKDGAIAGAPPDDDIPF